MISWVHSSYLWVLESTYRVITLRNHKKRKRADLFPKKEQHSWKSILGSVVTLVGLQSILYPRKSTQQNERLMMLERNDETVSISVIETTFCIHNGKHSSSMVGMNNGKQSKNQKSSSSQMWDSAFSHSGNGCICVWLCTILINEVNMVMDFFCCLISSSLYFFRARIDGRNLSKGKLGWRVTFIHFEDLEAKDITMDAQPIMLGSHIIVLPLRERELLCTQQTKKRVIQENQWRSVKNVCLSQLWVLRVSDNNDVDQSFSGVECWVCVCFKPKNVCVSQNRLNRGGDTSVVH